MRHLKVVGPSTAPEKATQSVVDTIMINKQIIKQWKAPPFQRPLRVNDKLMRIAEQLKADDGVVPGMITLGVLGDSTYLVDGQHRIHAFEMSDLDEGYADVRTIYADDMAAMATEYVNINSKISAMRPDDNLRALESSVPALRRIRRDCPFVGYDMIRRSDKAPLLSMTMVLRAWAAATMEVPMSGGMTAANRALGMSDIEAEACAKYLNICLKAWGRDPEYVRLWGALNLSIVGWLYRRITLGHGANNQSRHVRLSGDEFGKVIMALSASEDYLSWLVGRQLTDRDRSPCYGRVKSLLVKRIELGGKKAMLPQPAWATSIRQQ